MVGSLDGDMSHTILGHCDLGLISRILVAGAYLLCYLRWESQIWCVDSSGKTEWYILFWVTLTLTSDLISMFSVSGAYLLYYK